MAFKLWSKKRIIYSDDQLNKEIGKLKTSESFTADTLELKKMKGISPEIGIESDDRYHIISWLEDRTHAGIYRCSYQIERKSPYKIEKIKEERLLGIQINFLY